MPAIIGLDQNFCRLPRQKTFIAPDSPTESDKLRRSGTSLDVYGRNSRAPSQKVLIPSDSPGESHKLRRSGTNLDIYTRAQSRASQDIKIVRHKTLDYEVWDIVTDNGPTRKAKVPANSPESLSRPDSSGLLSERLDRHRKFPVLGPTRQETESYFRKKRRGRPDNELQGLSLRGPPSNIDDKNFSVGENTKSQSDSSQYDVSTGDIQNKLRGSLNSLPIHPPADKRNGQKVQLNDNPLQYQDIRFFAELVKPIQYRLRRKKEKVITPSKHGYHPRSQSPTFKRLVEATEKLQLISEKTEKSEKESTSLTDKDNTLTDEDSWQCPGRIVSSKSNQKLSSSEHYSVASDSALTTPRNIYINIANISSNPGLEIPHQFPPKSAISEEDNDSEDDENDDDNHRSEAYFKVDFKVEESHASLKLFLPHINGMREKTEDDIALTEAKSSDSPVKFPPLVHQNTMYNRPLNRFRRNIRRNTSKKRKKIERCPSASDSDKRIEDHLNDVSTLISLQTDGCRALTHTVDTLCPFTNCPYHIKLADEKG